MADLLASHAQRVIELLPGKEAAVVLRSLCLPRTGLL